MRTWRSAILVLALGACTEAPLDLQLFPSDDDFGPVAVGATSAPHQFTLTNAGPGATQPLVVELGTNQTDFALASDGCSGHAVPANGTCQVLVTFTPTARAPRQDSLAIRSGSSSSAAQVRGEGVDSALLHVTPSTDPHDYGAVLAGGPGQTAVFLVGNDGGATGPALALSISGADAAMFALSQDRCTGKALAASATCSFAVTFQPPLSATGSHSATLAMGGGLTLGLVGAALHSASLAWSPPAHDFGGRQVSLDDASGDLTLTLSNAGNLDSSTVSVSATGSDFILRSTTCGAALTPGASCAATVRFVPSAGGARGGSLIATAAQGAPAGVSALLTGAGQWQVLVSKGGSATGTVTSTPAGITCDLSNTDCSQLYDDQTALALTAAPSGGARLTSWSGCMPVNGQPLQCSLALDGAGAIAGAYAVTATFDP